MEAFYDLSGSCHNVKTKRRYSKQHRPHASREMCEAIGADYGYWKNTSAQRVLYFTTFPEADQRYTLVSRCANNNCINLEHAMIGLFNPRSRVVAARRQQPSQEHATQPLLPA